MASSSAGGRRPFERERPSAYSVRPVSQDGRARARFGRSEQTVFAPQGFEAGDDAARRPYAELRLQWAHGYNGTAPASLHWVSDHEIVFPVARVGVVQHLDRHSQHFFLGHNAAITCLAFCEAKMLCVSGQGLAREASEPFVCIWSPKDCGLRTVLVFHEARLHGVAFSPQGDRIFSLGGNVRTGYKMAVWTDFEPSVFPKHDVDHKLPLVKREPRGQAFATKCPAYGMAVASASGGTVRFVSYDAGMSHAGLMLHFWTCTAAQGAEGPVELKGRLGVFHSNSPEQRPRAVLSCSWSPDGLRCYACCDNGFLYAFDGAEVTWQYKVCNGALGFAVEVPGCGFFLAGRGNNTLYFGGPRLPEAGGTQAGLPGGDQTLDPRRASSSRGGGPGPQRMTRFADAAEGGAAEWLVAMPLKDVGGALVCSSAQLEMQDADVRVLSSPHSGRLALVGTANHYLLLFDLDRQRLIRTLTQAHGGETTSLCFYPRPELQLFATGSIDGTVRFWDWKQRTPVVGRVLSYGASQGVLALDFSPTGDLLAIVHQGAVLRALNFPELQPVQVRAPAAAPATERYGDVKFDPTGRWLAVTTGDRQVFVYEVMPPQAPGAEQVLELRRKLAGNTSAVTQVQFFSGGSHLMTNSKDKQLIFFNTQTGERCALEALQNARWDGAWTATCGWPVVGMWAARQATSSGEIHTCCSFEAPGTVPLRRCDGFLASGDDQGFVNLYRFPAVCEKQVPLRYHGHSAYVTVARFAPPAPKPPPPPPSDNPTEAERAFGAFDALLATAGGDDRALLQWGLRCLRPEQRPHAPLNCPWVDPLVGPDPRHRFRETGGRATNDDKLARTQLWGWEAQGAQSPSADRTLRPPSGPGARSLLSSQLSGTACHHRRSPDTAAASASAPGRRRPASASAATAARRPSVR